MKKEERARQKKKMVKSGPGKAIFGKKMGREGKGWEKTKGKYVQKENGRGGPGP